MLFPNSRFISYYPFDIFAWVSDNSNTACIKLNFCCPPPFLPPSQLMATSSFSYSGQNLEGYTHIQPDRKSAWLSSGFLTVSSLVRLDFSPGFPKFPNWSPSPLSICTSSSSRQSLKACFVLNRFGFSMWKGSWPVFGAVKVRIGVCLLFSPCSSFKWCLQFPRLYLLSRVWRFPDVYHQPQSCSSA